MSGVDDFFRISKDVSYVALYLDGQLTLRERPGLANASASESDKYEELIVNPAVLLLARQRGNIDCGGVEFIVIRYRNFWQTVWPVKNGHLSLGLEPSANPLEHAKAIQRAIAEQGLCGQLARRRGPLGKSSSDTAIASPLRPSVIHELPPEGTHADKTSKPRGPSV